MPEVCSNPICEKRVKPVAENRWRRTPRIYCSNACNRNSWAIRRAAELLSPLPVEKLLEILEAAITCKFNGASTINQNTQIYCCTKWPSLSIGKRIRFRDGLFETRNPELQKEIERNDSFGAHIHRFAD